MRVSLLVAVALLIAFAAFLASAPKPHEPRFQSLEQQNRHVIERYRGSAGAWPVVYVGSSMAARLASDVDTRCVYDLALSGDSILTALHVLVDESIVPQAVFIETNVPERPANARLIASTHGWLGRDWRLFATENKPINLLLGYLHQWRTSPMRGVDAGLQAIGLDVQRFNYAQTIAAQTLSNNLQDIEQHVRALQRRGTEVVLFEMPTHQSLQGAPRARQIRDAFREKFPDLDFVSAEELALGTPIQTVDGVHLAPDESPQVAASLATHHVAACNGAARDSLETVPEGGATALTGI